MEQGGSGKRTLQGLVTYPLIIGPVQNRSQNRREFGARSWLATLPDQPGIGIRIQGTIGFLEPCFDPVEFACKVCVDGVTGQLQLLLSRFIQSPVLPTHMQNVHPSKRNEAQQRQLSQRHGANSRQVSTVMSTSVTSFPHEVNVFPENEP